MLHLMANHEIKSNPARDAQHGQQLLRTLLNETPITADDAARDIVCAHLQFALKTLGGLHLGLAEESKATRISPILLEHVEARAVLLVLDNDQGLIERNQLIILVDEHVFIGQPDISLTLKQGVLGIAIDDIGAVYQLLITLAARLIKALKGRRCHPLGEISADKRTVLGNIQANQSGILVAAMFVPALENLFHRIIRHEVVAVDTSVQGGIDIAVGGVVRAMHSLVLLIDIADCYLAFGNPSVDQFPCVVGRAVVNDEPAKVLAGLSAQALIGSAYRVCTIIGRSENSQCCH